MHINGKDNSSVEHQGQSEPLYHHRSHLFIDAMALDIDHRVHHHWVQYIQQHGFYGEQHILLSSDEPQHHAGEALPAQSLRSPVLPSQQEQDTHSLTHQPYRSWCRVCQPAKGRGGQHRRQHQQEENVSIIQLDYTFMRDPHQAPQRQGRQTTFTILTAIESTTGLGLAVLTSKKGYTPHQAAQLHRWIIKHGFTKSVLQSDHETSLMQLVSTVATDLKLPTRVSPPYSHQSQGKVERFHRNLFDQLRTTRLQWSKDLNIEPHMLPPESLPCALHHSIFILNNYLVHSSGKTSHFDNYRCNYRSNVVHFGEIALGDVRNIPTQKLRLRNQHQKLRGIWLGRDLITNEHILALPLHYSQHPSTTSTGAYRCRQITRVPREEQHDVKFLESIYWPQLSDDIDFNIREHFNNLQKQNIATRDLQLQQPPEEEDIEQPQGVQPPVLRHHPQAVAPPQEPQPPVVQPPPGLPPPPQVLQPRPQAMVKQQALPLPVRQLQGPPPKVQAAPVPQAPAAVHRPTGKHYNPPRGPPPKAANIIDIPCEEDHEALLGENLVDISVDSGILQVATNIDKKEQQLQQDIIKQTIELQDFYEDDLSQF